MKLRMSEPPSDVDPIHRLKETNRGLHHPTSPAVVSVTSACKGLAHQVRSGADGFSPPRQQIPARLLMRGAARLLFDQPFVEAALSNEVQAVQAADFLASQSFWRLPDTFQHSQAKGAICVRRK